MDDLESAMNIPQIFEKYTDCVLNISLKVGAIQVARTDNVIQINYRLPGKNTSLYKIIAYSDLAKAFYYNFFIIIFNMVRKPCLIIQEKIIPNSLNG